MKKINNAKLKNILIFSLFAAILIYMSSCSRQMAASKFSGTKDIVDVPVTANDYCRPHFALPDNTPEVDVALPNVFALQPMLPPTVSVEPRHTIAQRLIEKKVARIISRSIEKASITTHGVKASHSHAVDTNYLTLGLILLIVGIIVGAVVGGIIGNLAYAVALVGLVLIVIYLVQTLT